MITDYKLVNNYSFNCPLSIVHCQLNDGGDVEDRTPYLLLARQALSQMSYTPKNNNN